MSATIWNIDQAHTEIMFKVKHLVISTVTGQFNDFSGTLETQGDSLEHAKAHFEAKINSIFTNQADRDAHLKSADFFDAENHPVIKIDVDSFSSKGGDDYELDSTIEIRGNSKKVKLKGEFGGIVVDGYGQTKLGIEITGKISRKEFGLSWNAVTEAGGVVVSDEIKLIGNVQFVKQA